jgi:N-acetylmuramoyl-L-alanine amidase
LVCAPVLVGALVSWAWAESTGLRVVVLDPGHGGTNQGAPARARGVGFEKDHTLVIAQKVAARLRAAGVLVYLTRETDLDLALADRVRFANARRADVFVSVHLNSTERPGPVGHETFFLSLEASDEASRRLARFENDEGGTRTTAQLQSPDGDVAGILLDLTQTRAHHDAERLAASIQGRMVKQSPFPNRGVLQAPFVVLMGAAMPAVVVEAGFLNHKDEGLFITSPEGHERIAQGIADGVLDFGRLVLAARSAQTQGVFAPPEDLPPDLPPLPSPLSPPSNPTRKTP